MQNTYIINYKYGIDFTVGTDSIEIIADNKEEVKIQTMEIIRNQKRYKDYWLEITSAELKTTNIKVYNDNELVFEGDSCQWLKYNEQDQEVFEMIEEAITAGSSRREFFHSGLWEVVTA